MTSELRSAVLTFARVASIEAIERLAETIEGDSITDPGAPSRLGARFPDPTVRHAVVRLLEKAGPISGLDQLLLVESLRSIAATFLWRAADERLELVWSGPRPDGSNLRRTDEAVLQLVRAARTRLSVVTFAAYRIASVADALREAILRGVQVRFFGETERGSAGRLTLDAARSLGSELAAKIEVYEWPRGLRVVEPGGRPGLLHAKFALADEHTLFVSSANLTEAALDVNMEMGLLVTGGTVPATAARHLDRLISEGFLRLVESQGQAGLP